MAGEAPQQHRSPGARGRRRPNGAYWPILATACAGLFLAAPDFSPWLRAGCVVVAALVLWVAFRFLEALVGDRARSRERAAPVEPQPPRPRHLALALPGLCGYAINVATVVSLSIEPPRQDLDAIGIIWFMLVGPLFVGSTVGFVAAFERPGRFRWLAIAANGAYVLSSVLFLYLLLKPRY